MEEPIEEFLVTVNEGVKLMGKGKDHMEIRRVNDLGPALVHPDFFLNSLTVGAVTVAAGVIMDLDMSAVRTLA